jgi:hypothetical protein
MLSSGGSQRAPGGAEIEAAPRRAALRGGLKPATGSSGPSSILLIPSIDQRRRQPTVCESSTLDSVRAIGVSLGSTMIGDFARVDMHAGEHLYGT